jgi:carbon-monoxide dehydrogenase small subunit/xanthine dehydrogenase small subunit
MRVHRPATLDEACAVLAEHAHDQDAPVISPPGREGLDQAEEAVERGWRLAARRVIPVAGGTDVLVHWPEHLEARDLAYMDLWRLPELRSMRWTDAGLEIGATTTYWEVERDAAAAVAFPLLVDAARQVGAVQIQARGTWAGNIANASPAADGVPVLMAYDAAVVLVSREGRREVPLERFYFDYKLLDMRPDELIAAVRLPRREYGVQRFAKVGSRRAQAIAKVGLALARSDRGWRVVAASVAPTVRRCRAIEAMLDAGERPRRPEDLLPALRADVKPIDDPRSTAAYRETVMARVLFAELQAAG